MDERFTYDTYLVRRKILSLVGASFHFYDPMGNVVLFARMKAFKLKEDITIFSGEDMQEPMLNIKARNIVDFSATYDVFDVQSNEKIGALRRKGLKSVLKDEWVVLDEFDNEIGIIKEDSTALALVRRFLINIIPQSYSCVMDGSDVCTYKQNVNPFVMKINIDFSMDSFNTYDRRLGIAAGLLLCAIEGKQN
ncbi:MAG: hypothetical protein BWY74_01009 [Firmicutes bacterium ADurb.Bin419]|nr:MAG: hypothetical protein BWY74_01009 [Firmicutes bacterium ADurb.Bin419]